MLLGLETKEQNARRLHPGVLVRRLTGCLLLQLDQWRRQTYAPLQEQFAVMWQRKITSHGAQHLDSESIGQGRVRTVKETLDKMKEQ